MAQQPKKPTKAERKEEARQRRLAELRRQQRAQRTRRIVWGLISLAVVAGIALILYFSQASTRKKTASLNKAAVAAGCSKVQTNADEGAGHLQQGEQGSYKANPPTSGKHNPSPAPTGVHTTAVADDQQVHNLEHGHIVVQYKPSLDQNLIDKLEDFVNTTDKRRLLLAPRENMPYQVAITSWDHVLGCSSPNAKVVDAAKAFYEDFKGKGPEGDLPGTPAT